MNEDYTKYAQASGERLSTLQLHADILAAEVAQIRSAIRHGTQKGSELEQAVISLLRNHLPAHLALTEGVVIASNGFKSSQIDIIIYDHSAPIFFSGESTRVVPIEYVYAVVEVKLRLDKADFEKAARDHRDIKRQSKHFMKVSDDSFIYHAYGTNWKSPPVASIIFACEVDAETKTLFGWYREEHAKFPINENVDVVFVNQKALLCRFSGTTGLDIYSGDCQSLSHINQNTMAYFIALLIINSTAWKMHERPEIFRYFTGVDVTIEASDRVLPPAHADILRPQMGGFLL